MPTGKPTAVTTNSTFAMECAVSCRIHASPERIWALLTDAEGFARWNSTVTRLEGPIAPGQTLAVEATSAPGRVFKPRVTAFEELRRMVWSDGMAPMFKGVRTFTLTPRDGATEFAMRERFSGLMLPVIKRSLPDFAPIFERYADDLKHAAEAGR